MVDETNITPINEKKIESLTSAYKKLPKNKFSKMIVIFCLGISTISIVVSFILLLNGIDASGILNPSLIFWGSELFIMGAKATFSREERAQDIIFDTITQDVQDGKLYDKNTGQIVTTENEYIADIEENNYVKENIVGEDNGNSENIIEKQSEKKKRGRPKKVIESKPKNNYKIANNGNIELTSSVNQDGRG